MRRLHTVFRLPFAIVIGVAMVAASCSSGSTDTTLATMTTVEVITTTTLATTTTTTTTPATPCATTTAVGDPLLLINGDFETGDLTGWTVDADEIFPSAWGYWFVYEDGNTSPSSGSRTYSYNVFEVPDPPQGRYAAVTDGNGPGRYILYQDFAVEVPASLRLVVFYRNRNASFIAPHDLRVKGVANQQFRIDLIDPDAPIDSLASEDVLRTVFQTEESDPNILGPTEVTFDLTPWVGQTVRLRSVNATNQSAMYVGFDNVCLEPTG